MLGLIILLIVFNFHRAEPVNITKPALTHNIEVIDNYPTTLAMERAEITTTLSTPSSTQKAEVIQNNQSKTDKIINELLSIVTTTSNFEVTEKTTKNSTYEIFTNKSIIENSIIKSTFETIVSKSINDSIKNESMAAKNNPNKTIANEHCTKTSDCKIAGQKCYHLEDSGCTCINGECIISSKLFKNII